MDHIGQAAAVFCKGICTVIGALQPDVQLQRFGVVRCQLFHIVVMAVKLHPAAHVLEADVRCLLLELFVHALLVGITQPLFLLLDLWIHLFPHQRQEGQAKAAGHQDQTDEHRDEIVFAALRPCGVIQHLAPQQDEACCRNDLQHQQRVKIRQKVISKEKYPRSNQANAQRHTAHPPDRLCLCGGRRRIFRDPARFRGGIRCRFLSVLDNFC